MARARTSQSTNDLLLTRKKQHGHGQKVESWDDDFGDLGDSVFQSSINSQSSLMGNKLLSAYSEDFDEEEDDDYDFEQANLTTKMSNINLRKYSSNKFLGHPNTNTDRSDGDDELDEEDREYRTIRQHPGHPGHVGTIKKLRSVSSAAPMMHENNNLEGDHEVFTVRAKKQASQVFDNHNNPLNQGFFAAPNAGKYQQQNLNRSKSPNRKQSGGGSPSKQQQSRNMRHNVIVEDFEDGFDVESNPGDLKSRLQKVKNQMHQDQDEEFDSWGEESLGFRANSRLSEASNASSVFSSSYEESEQEGEDFFQGVEIPEKHVNFQQILDSKQRDAQQIAEHEEEQLLQGKKYDTIRSSGSGNSIKNLDALQDNEDDLDLDFFDGIEVGEDAFQKPKEETMHKNVIVKDSNNGKNVKNAKSAKESLRIKKSMPSLRDDSSARKKSPTKPPRIGENSLGEISPVKKTRSSSSTAQLRPVQSMSNFGTRKPSARPRYTRAKTGKVFGDGTELDSLMELPTNHQKEQSFTVTPKASKTGTIKHKPLETYREKSKEKRKQQQQQQQLAAKPSKANLAASSKKRSSKDSKRQKGPGLIQQLGPPTASIVSRGYNGDMKFNPRKLVWEGNDIELKKFESVNTKAPGLIAFISNKGVQVVGDMVFDPEKMCWIRVGHSGEDDEKDPFEGVEDLDVSVRSKASTIRPSLGSSTATQQGEFEVGNEFEITNDMIRRLQHEEERWYRKCSSWFSPDETFDREYLNEIRQMVMK